MTRRNRTDRRLPQPIRRRASASRRRSTSRTPPTVPRLNLTGEEAELLVRHRGEPLKALQHVVDMAFGSRAPTDEAACSSTRSNTARARTSSCARWRSSSREKAKRHGAGSSSSGPLNPLRAAHRASWPSPKCRASTTESIGDAFSKTVHHLVAKSSSRIHGRPVLAADGSSRHLSATGQRCSQRPTPSWLLRRPWPRRDAA